MRPDQHPLLRMMGKGHETCDVCVMQLFQGMLDSICNDCVLNPLGTKEAFAAFIDHELGLTEGMGGSELLSRVRRMTPLDRDPDEIVKVMAQIFDISYEEMLRRIEAAPATTKPTH